MVTWMKRGKPAPGDDDDIASETCTLASDAGQHVMFVKKLALNHLDDILPIQSEIEGGTMAIIDVAGFISAGQFSVLELRRAIEQIRGTCKALGGALARLGDRYLIATPNDKTRLAA